MSLDSIVSVRVTINQSTVAQQGFGTPLVFAHHTHFTDPVRTYNANGWEAAMATDLFVPAEAAYQAAAAIMKQSPRPSTFKIGLRTTAETQIVWLTPTVANLATYKVSVDAPAGTTKTASFVSDASATLAEICTGLASAINALTQGTTADGTSGTKVVCTANASDRVLSYHSLTPNLSLEDHTVATGLEADLNAIKAYDNDWYGLALASSAPDAIEQCADWTELNKKIFVASTHDMRPLTNASDDIVSSIDSQNYARTHVAYNSRAGTFYGASWLAALLPYEPGQADWKFKTLKGPYTDKLTSQQETYLLGKGGSYYESPIKGLDMTGAAKGGDGIFLDLTQLSDWTVARIQEGIVSMLAASPKTGFTDQDGGNKIWGVLHNVVQMGIRNNAVDEDPDTYAVYVPKRAELSPAARAARIWENCSLTFKPTGAVHSVGTISVLLNVA